MSMWWTRSLRSKILNSRLSVGVSDAIEIALFFLNCGLYQKISDEHTRVKNWKKYVIFLQVSSEVVRFFVYYHTKISICCNQNLPALFISITSIVQSYFVVKVVRVHGNWVVVRDLHFVEKLSRVSLRQERSVIRIFNVFFSFFLFPLLDRLITLTLLISSTITCHQFSLITRLVIIK